MQILAAVLIAFVALLQTSFLVLEMFLWQTPGVRKRFGLSPEFAAQSAALAKNQGLYNGFLAAGLVWGLTAADSGHALAIQVFFLSCVVIAGLYGAWTVKKSIAFIQALPASLALAAVLAS